MTKKEIYDVLVERPEIVELFKVVHSKEDVALALDLLEKIQNGQLKKEV